MILQQKIVTIFVMKNDDLKKQSQLGNSHLFAMLAQLKTETFLTIKNSKAFCMLMSCDRDAPNCLCAHSPCKDVVGQVALNKKFSIVDNGAVFWFAQGHSWKSAVVPKFSKIHCAMLAQLHRALCTVAQVFFTLHNCTIAWSFYLVLCSCAVVLF